MKTREWDLIRRCAVCFFLALAAVFAYKATTGVFLPTQLVVASNRAVSCLQTKSIEMVKVGDRVLGRNPIRQQVEGVEPDLGTWRTIRLHMLKKSGKPIYIELIRPLSWFDHVSPRVGQKIAITKHEMGAVGEAVVTYVGPCPVIKSGGGAVVTGVFRHQADANNRVVQLQLEGQNELTGVTDSHAYWSIDRQKFIQVASLRRDEMVDTKFGPRRVLSVTSADYSGFLYNLETTEHVYRVDSLGTLVHNDCLDYARRVFRRRRAGEVIRMEPIRGGQTGPLPDYPFTGTDGIKDGAVSAPWHAFHLENGVLRDPPHPRGIPYEDWLAKLAELNGIEVNDIPKFYNFETLYR